MAKQKWARRTVTFSGPTHGEADAKFGEWLLVQRAGRIRNVKRREVDQPISELPETRSTLVEYEMLVDAGGRAVRGRHTKRTLRAVRKTGSRSRTRLRPVRRNTEEDRVR
jgi:hypothetical protein